jgi:hypothetical protein
MVKWSDEDNLYLFTPKELEKIPEGTVLTCIDMENYTKGII